MTFTLMSQTKPKVGSVIFVMKVAAIAREIVAVITATKLLHPQSTQG